MPQLPYPTKWSKWIQLNVETEKSAESCSGGHLKSGRQAPNGGEGCWSRPGQSAGLPKVLHRILPHILTRFPLTFLTGFQYIFRGPTRLNAGACLFHPLLITDSGIRHKHFQLVQQELLQRLPPELSPAHKPFVDFLGNILNYYSHFHSNSLAPPFATHQRRTGKPRSWTAILKERG